VHQKEKMLGVPVRGYVATSRRVNRKEWEDSIRWCSTELEHLSAIRWCSTELGIIVNISKQNAETSHGVNIVVTAKHKGSKDKSFGKSP
jgi:hypothetical protein